MYTVPLDFWLSDYGAVASTATVLPSRMELGWRGRKRAGQVPAVAGTAAVLPSREGLGWRGRQGAA